MRKLAVFLIVLSFYGCRPNTQNIYSSVFSVDVSNPLDEPREDIVVFISHDLLDDHPDFNPKYFKVLDQEAEIASEYDEGIIVVLDKMRGKETRSLTIYYNPQGETEHNYTKRTQAELSHKIGGEWKDREYIGGQFRKVDRLRVPPEHKDHSWFLRYEGPGWESDQVGYRLYLDQRNAIDVFGKKTKDVVLMGVGQDGFDSYHSMQPWGMDVMKVGKSLGLGSLGVWADTSAVRVEKTDSVICSVHDGLLLSSINVKYYGWKTPKDTLTLESRMFINAGTRWTTNSTLVSKSDAQICTGIVKDTKAKLFKSPGNESTFGYIATYGKQSLNNDNLGLAVIFDPASFVDFREDSFSHVIDLKPVNGSVDYYFAAAWELEPNGITNEADFIKYVERSARELANPVVVNLKEPR